MSLKGALKRKLCTKNRTSLTVQPKSFHHTKQMQVMLVSHRLCEEYVRYVNCNVLMRESCDDTKTGSLPETDLRDTERKMRFAMIDVPRRQFSAAFRAGCSFACCDDDVMMLAQHSSKRKARWRARN